MTHYSENTKKVMAITYGDPEGVGVEIVNRILSENLIKNLLPNFSFIIFGSKKLIHIPTHLQNSVQILELNTDILEAGEHSFRYLEAAANACLAKQCVALVTGPISKDRWIKAGHNWKGQTEFLGSLTGQSPEMLFITRGASPWRVLLLTRHIALKEVPSALTYIRMKEAVETLRIFLKEKYSIQEPRIALAGLNPHAGENGALGDEELKWKDWIQDLKIEGPFSADDIWVRSSRAYIQNQAQEFDAYLAPYHDQVLPLIKSVTNFRAVNVSTGLPFLRTSPDHGTAFSLVGTGKADPQPFIEAINLACEVA
jgi:4-hydroxythreonine-4-phosphate dehydrogenase